MVKILVVQLWFLLKDQNQAGIVVNFYKTGKIASK